VSDWLIAKHCALLALLIVAAYTDLSRGKVYNWCTYPAMFLGLAMGYVLDAYGSGNLVNSVYGMLLVAVIFGLPYFLRWICAGDLKLMAAIAALAGAKMAGHYFIVYAAVYSAVVGAVIAIGVLIWKGRLWAGLKGSAHLLVAFRRGRRAASPADADAGSASTEAERIEDLTIPYGFAIASGTMLAWFVFLARGLLQLPRA